MEHEEHAAPPIARIDLFLNGSDEPFDSVLPPAHVEVDTSTLADGPHELRLEAYDTEGKVGRRTIPFVVQNGPGITVNGLRSGERVGGRVGLEVNAFGGGEPFDPIRAESSGPIPVWTWVLVVVVVGWAAWYALFAFGVPSVYAATPTYESNPVAMAAQPMTQAAPTRVTGGGSAGGFDYAATGEQLYTQNCAACHGASGTGVPGAFPPLAGDPVVTASDPAMHIKVVLHGLSKVPIKGIGYSSQMPPFPQLSDSNIAAIIDHERTSWGNQAPIITPDAVKRAR
jgi:mono/diheme cytochrome c family protein